MPLLWLSFADDDGPRGVVLIEAEDVKDAAVKCWKLGINPGGQIMAVVIPPGDPEAKVFPHNKLITITELKEHGYRKIKELPEDLQKRIEKDQHDQGHSKMFEQEGE